MTEHEAVVTRLVGDFALLEVASPDGCGSCASKRACGSASLMPRRYAVRNTVGARPGDQVLVSVPEGTILKAAALTYLMPLLFVIAGAVAGTAWSDDGMPAVMGAAAGLAVGLAALRFVSFFAGTGREPLLNLTLKRRIILIDKEPDHA